MVHYQFKYKLLGVYQLIVWDWENFAGNTKD